MHEPPPPPPKRCETPKERIVQSCLQECSKWAPLCVSTYAHEEWFFHPVVTSKGFVTPAYQPWRIVHSFIREVCSQETQPGLGRDLTSAPGVADSVLKELTSGKHVCLPRLVRNTAITAWSNGIFFASMPYFHCYA